jgi:excisionase family DNA binding protein
MKDIPKMTQPLAVSIPEAARLAGIGRSSLYEAINKGDLPIRKCGRRSLVLLTDLSDWIASLPSSVEG